MNRKTKIISFIIIVIVALYGGYKYGQSHPPVSTNQNQLSFANGSSTGQFAGRAGRGVGGGVRGDIVKKDAQSLTISLPAGGSQIIWYSTSTDVQKTVTASADDLTVGQTVMVNGSANSDGSLTANSIQLR